MNKFIPSPINDLSAHPLMKQVVQDVRPIIETVDFKKFSLKKKRTESTLPNPYAYFHGCLKHIGTMARVVERLDQIRLFMRCFPRRKRFEQHRITQDKWIVYHYANFVTTIVSSYDIALILTNYVFRLGNNPRQCKTETVRENAWVKGTPVKGALENIEKLIKPYVQPRHLHVHRGEPPDLEILDELEVISSLNLTDPIFPPALLKGWYRDVTKEIDERAAADNLKLTLATSHLFTALHDIYRVKVLSLPPVDPEFLKNRAKAAGA